MKVGGINQYLYTFGVLMHNYKIFEHENKKLLEIKINLNGFFGVTKYHITLDGVNIWNYYVIHDLDPTEENLKATPTRTSRIKFSSVLIDH